jgi:hypothetical protein
MVPLMTEAEWQQLQLDDKSFRLIFFQEPNLRPPVLDEMMADIERLIHSVAQRYADSTSSQLNVEEMIGEGHLKLAELLSKGELDRQFSRTNFFKFLKASLQNQAKSRIQKYMFTEKRTGIKPPKRVHGQVPAVADETTKHLELRLDDDENHLQIPDFSEDTWEWKHVVEEYSALLTEIEGVVLRQLITPNQMALIAATEDARRGRKRGKFTIKIKHHHLALGLECSDQLFEEIVLSIRNKVLKYRAMTEEERQDTARRDAIVAQLKAVFMVQVPPNLDEMAVRRLFTIAARDQFEKVNSQVSEMLEAIGAKVPRIQQDSMLSCYGVLYQPNVRQCVSCGLKRACYVEASNLGLNTIALSPKLLGARQIRTPVVLPTIEGEELDGGSYEEAEVVSHLREYYVQFKRGQEYFFGHNAETTAGRPVLLFCVGTQFTPLQLRFCNPSETLKRSLVMRAKCWYAPNSISTADLILLIEQHAKEALEPKELANHG